MPRVSKKAVAALVISLVAYFMYVGEFFNLYISRSIDIHMILLVCLTYYLYIVLALILERRVLEKDRYTVKFMYIIFLITMFFSKDINTHAGYINTFNLDIKSMTYSLNTTIGILFIVMNVVLIIPVGWMCRKLDVIVKILLPILMFLIVEYLQYVFEVGVFDINDIILNSIGFYIGSFIFGKFG